MDMLLVNMDIIRSLPACRAVVLSMLLAAIFKLLAAARSPLLVKLLLAVMLMLYSALRLAMLVILLAAFAVMSRLLSRLALILMLLLLEVSSISCPLLICSSIAISAWAVIWVLRADCMLPALILLLCEVIVMSPAAFRLLTVTCPSALMIISSALLVRFAKLLTPTPFSLAIRRMRPALIEPKTAASMANSGLALPSSSFFT